MRSNGAKNMILSNEELTKKLKATRKRVRGLEEKLGSEREARKSLEEKVKSLDSTNQTLMFNLRRVLKKMDMNPSRPKA